MSEHSLPEDFEEIPEGPEMDQFIEAVNTIIEAIRNGEIDGEYFEF